MNAKNDGLHVGVGSDGEMYAYDLLNGKIQKQMKVTGDVIESVLWFMKRNDIKYFDLNYTDKIFNGKPTLFMTDDPEKVSKIKNILKNQ